RSFYREGQESDWSWESRRQAVQRDLGGRNVRYDVYTGKADADLPSESPVAIAQKKAAVAGLYQNRYLNDAATTDQKIASANHAIETLNARILPVLAGTTEKDFGDNPKAWWDWWRNQNEYYTSDHPVGRGYDSAVDQYTYGLPTMSIVSSAPP